MPVKTISIIVNTLNRVHLLKNLLESFRHLDYDDFEVVIVNGPSTDGTEVLLSEWKDIIKIGDCSEANLAMSRNIGIAMAAGEFVAFIDDDAIPEPEWLNQAIDAFESEDVAGAGGPVFDHTGYNYQCKYVNATRLGNGIWHYDQPSPYNCFPCAFEFPYLSGGNVVFRRSALLKIGGFDEEYQYYLDETDICLRLIDAGYILRQLPNSFIHHKFAPSHLREHKIPKYRYPILKSKIYFSNRHARNYCTQSEIDSDNNAFIESHRNQIIECVSENIFTDLDLQEFEEHARDALTHGKQAAEMPQKLITQDLLQSSNMLPYKKFQTIQCDGVSLTIAFLCEYNTYSPEDETRCIARDKAKELAALGHKVHVIVHGYDHNTVDFEHGIWVHRILPVDNVKSEKAGEFNIPQEAWNQSKAFLDELDRITSHRNIDIVQAPITNMVGSAAILSEKYSVITSLSSNEVKLFKSDINSSEGKIHEADKALEFIKLYVLKNSKGILTDDIEAINSIEVFCDTVNTYDKSMSRTQAVSALIQDYRKILNEVYN